MQRSLFHLQKMDCPSEEQLIRLKLAEFTDITALQFDLSKRVLEVYHSQAYQPILAQLESLDLDTTYLSTSTVRADLQAQPHAPGTERRLLLQVLAINFSFFLLEILAGVFAHSIGLVADSLDMLADSFVYALALYAIGGTLTRKKNIARASGYLQLGLAILGALEVIRRFLGFDELPDFQVMIAISILALLGNTASLLLLQKSRNTEAHMQASMIFTSNDVIVNLGVILAGVLVLITHSALPDLLVGAIVFVIVARGAYRILQLAK